MRRWLDSSWVLIVVIGAFAAGFATASNQIFVASNWKLGWEMLSAIGTISAVVVALIAAFRESLRRRNEQLQRATIAAAKHVVHLKNLEIDLYTLCSELSFEKHHFDTIQPSHLVHFEKLITALSINIPDEDLFVLVSLPSSVGEKIARARADLQAAQVLFAGYCFGNSEEVSKWINKVWVSLCRAYELVRESATACEKAVSKHRVFVTSFTNSGTKRFGGLN